MEEIRETSDRGIKFLIEEEGLVKRPYKDKAGIPTIGIGCTYYENGQKVKMSDPPITTERAISLFRNLLKIYELAVYTSTRDDINHNQFDALTCFTFNVGVYGFKSSELVRKVNKDKQDPSITSAFEAWRNATINGVKKPVLLSRRKREAALYFTPDNSISKSPEEIYTEHVKYIQTKLGLHSDGIFGKNTKTAVINFQKLHGLIADGIVGPQTLAILNKI
ncbi:glycoside hydrolase family protein [Pedobacter panaciterrae]